MTFHDQPLICTNTLSERYPAQIGQHHYPVRIPDAGYQPYTEPTHVWRIIENLKIKPWKWVEREIDLAFNFGMPCVQSCTKLKLENHVMSCRIKSQFVTSFYDPKGTRRAIYMAKKQKKKTRDHLPAASESFKNLTKMFKKILKAALMTHESNNGTFIELLTAKSPLQVVVF